MDRHNTTSEQELPGCLDVLARVFLMLLAVGSLLYLTMASAIERGRPSPYAEAFINADRAPYGFTEDGRVREVLDDDLQLTQTQESGE